MPSSDEAERSDPLEFAPDIGVPDASASWPEREAIARAVARLSPDHREVVVLRYYADLPVEEIAGARGIRVGTVEARERHTATALPDGRVLVVGGAVGTADGSTVHSSAEMWDPVAGSFGTVAALGQARFDHTATLLADGRVLIVGGTGNEGVIVGSAEVWAPRGHPRVSRSARSVVPPASMSTDLSPSASRTVRVGDPLVADRGSRTAKRCCDPECMLARIGP
jgi:Sigma-70, region 4/Galactose oxidase, central domain